MIGIVFGFSGPSSGQEHRAEDLEFFENKIRPVLVEHCYECHSQDADPAEANLRVDSIAGLLRGGDNGPAVNRENNESNLLLSALHYDEFNMPPAGKLPETTIADFQVWVEKGLPAPRSFQTANGTAVDGPPDAPIDWDKARQHWAFRPIQPTAPPAVANAQWNINPIDAFIYQGLV